MKLKKFIIFTIILSSVFVAIGLYFDTPVAYIPQDVTGFEYMMTKLLFAITIAVVILSVIVHIKNNTKLQDILKKKRKLSNGAK